MFISIPILIVILVIAILGFYVGQKYLPSILEHDHDVVIRMLTRMDGAYEKVVATKARMDSQRLNILDKISNAIKPSTKPADAPAADAAPKA